MSKFVIRGGRPLKGSIKVAGNKNAAVPILAATLLAKDECLLENVPCIGDVLTMGQILKDLGAKVEGLGTSRLVINTKGVKRYQLKPELVEKLRASILFLGPLLALFGKAKMRHPGGCIIGRRAVGTHFEALENLGALTVTGEKDYESQVKKAKSAEVFLDEASVTATENTMMMAALTPGLTVIKNAACEPHVQDLAIFLNKMGARIKGAGTNQIVITGVSKMKGAEHRISPDYMETGTFVMMAAVNRSKIEITDIHAPDLAMILLYLKRFGVEYRLEPKKLVILPSKLTAPKGKVQTRPWPGFPTDLMSSLIVLATQAEGTTLCHDWMYESRMYFTDKLITMGADITLCDPHRVLVSGPSRLRGKVLDSPDIRAGIALVLAALSAEGESQIGNIQIIERGYEKLEARLKLLGAKIKTVD